MHDNVPSKQTIGNLKHDLIHSNYDHVQSMHDHVYSKGVHINKQEGHGGLELLTLYN